MIGPITSERVDIRDYNQKSFGYGIAGTGGEGSAADPWPCGTGRPTTAHCAGAALCNVGRLVPRTPIDRFEISISCVKRFK